MASPSPKQVAPLTLAQRLRSETKTLHAEAERSGAMRALLRGELDRHRYCLMLRNLHAIYATLEAALLAHASDPLIAPLQAADLVREGSLATDLDALHGTDWRLGLPVAHAASLYVERLSHHGRTQPHVLLAHAYVRYLGDLSGGQILQGIVQASLQLDGDEGTRFYRFAPFDAHELAMRFRRALDGMRLALPEADAIVAEARWAFSAHTRLFEELVQPVARRST